MPINVTKFTNQNIVVWVPSGTGSAGQTLYAQPIQMLCRWDDLAEEVQMLDGRRIISNAALMLASAVPLGSLVMKGTLATFKAMPTYPRIPTKTQGAFEVFRSSGTPAKNGSDLLFQVWL